MADKGFTVEQDISEMLVSPKELSRIIKNEVATFKQENPLGFEWLAQTLPASTLAKLNKKIATIESEFSGYIGLHYKFDTLLQKLRKHESLPEWLYSLGTPIIDHAFGINENLFLSYPYGFGQEQFIELGRRAKENGYYIKVDPISSRFQGGNLRIVIWKPISNTKKTRPRSN